MCVAGKKLFMNIVGLVLGVKWQALVCSCFIEISLSYKMALSILWFFAALNTCDISWWVQFYFLFWRFFPSETVSLYIIQTSILSRYSQNCYLVLANQLQMVLGAGHYYLYIWLDKNMCSPGWVINIGLQYFFLQFFFSSHWVFHKEK